MVTTNDDRIDSGQKEILVIDVLKRQLLRFLLIYFLVSNVFILLRIILRIFGADPQNLFASFIFTVSGFFLLPFFGIFPRFQEDIIADEPTFDISAFIGAFCSNILIFLVMSVIYLAARMIKTRKQTRETLERSKPIDTTTIEESVD